MKRFISFFIILIVFFFLPVMVIAADGDASTADKLKALITLENFIWLLIFLDTLVGALPNSWVKYKGILLSIATVLKDFDLPKRK